MKTFLQIVLLTLAVAGVAPAPDTLPVPEINSGGALTAVGLLAGGLLVMRGGRRKS